MSTNAELIQKRQEVREEILALKDHILSARLFNQLGKIFKQNSAAYWLSIVVLLNLILLTPYGLLGWVLDEIERTIPIIAEVILAIELTIFVAIVAHIAHQNLLSHLASRIVEEINNTDDLSKMLLWLQQSLSVQSTFSYVLPFGLAWLALGMYALSAPIHQFIGVGLSLGTFFTGLLAGINGYTCTWICLFVSRLKEYQYKMNVFSPADSEILSDISEVMAKAIYMLSGLTAVVTISITSSSIDESIRNIFSIPLVVFGWILIITQYLLTRSTLSTITDRAKWKTLNRLRDKINALEATGDLSDKDTADRLLRLADIHKQILASNTKTFDLKSVTTLFSQLMLPLLGMFLGNLENVLEVLR